VTTEVNSECLYILFVVASQDIISVPVYVIPEGFVDGVEKLFSMVVVKPSWT